MAMRDSDLDRLLRCARDGDEIPAVPPFGFETRLLALSRAARGEKSNVFQEFSFALQRIGMVAFAVMAFAGIGAYWQLSENDDESEPMSNAYAIADVAIDSNLLQ